MVAAMGPKESVLHLQDHDTPQTWKCVNRRFQSHQGNKEDQIGFELNTNQLPKQNHNLFKWSKNYDSIAA